MLLILKLTVTPLLVAAMSLAARRFGPTIGGLMMGLPWMTGPILFFLGLEWGNTYLIATARGALLAVPAIAVFIVVYWVLARFCRWYPSLAGAAAAFALSGWSISTAEVSHDVAALWGAGSLLLAFFFIPRPLLQAAPRVMPWWDIPLRMLATAVLIAGIAATADTLGPTLSGIVSSYPVILTVIATFTHHRWGADAVTALLRGVALSLLSFVAFFWVVSKTAADLGLVVAFCLATLSALAVSGVLIGIMRWRAARATAAVQ